MIAVTQPEVIHLHVLSWLLFGAGAEANIQEVHSWGEIWQTARAHHVAVRAGREANRRSLLDCGVNGWLEKEATRISSTIRRLAEICDELQASEVRVCVIKSLDHWPDFGSDIDLFTDAAERRVSALMRSLFGAEIMKPTVGDRLAKKVNYRVPGLNELVEIHFGRLGQAGEHVELALRVLSRQRVENFERNLLPVPAPEERLILATLQRMYRHFCIRLCDIANTAAILESGTIDFGELRRASKRAGIWPGVATYLRLVSEYVHHYRERSLPVPDRVIHAARFGLKKIYPHAGFLRVPLFPQVASLYTRQLAKSARRDPSASLRLSLLPSLAAAAGAKYKITGSDKGVW